MIEITVTRRYRRHFPALAAAAVIGAALVAAFVLTRGGGSPTRLQLFLGRTHPLVVHLPIGFLLLALFLEAASRVRSFARVRHSVPLALVMSAASAIAAAAAGSLLAAGGGYEGPTVLWHKRLGIGVAVACVGATALWYAAYSRRLPGMRRVYELSLFAAAGLLMTTGHLGGTLTHGSEYLTEYMPAPLRTAMQALPGEAPQRATFNRIDEAALYEHLVKPVLQARCVSCHGPERQKGGLRLDSAEAILKGGESGPGAVPHRPEESEIVRRLWLPEDHEGAMPPRGRKPLSVAEAELVRWWIEEGASVEKTIAEVNPPPSVMAILEQMAGPPEERIAPILRTRIAAADTAALRKARDAGVSLRPIARGSAFLEAHCTGRVEPCGSQQVGVLLSLAPHITALHLGGSAIKDEDLASIARMPNLTSLHLERTAITDRGLVHLGRLQHLEYLNLYGTRVSDAGLTHIAGLKNLRSLYLWQTAATPAGAERLRSRIARVQVSLGLGRAGVDSVQAARRDTTRVTAEGS